MSSRAAKRPSKTSPPLSSGCRWIPVSQVPSTVDDGDSDVSKVAASRHHGDVDLPFVDRCHEPPPNVNHRQRRKYSSCGCLRLSNSLFSNPVTYTLLVLLPSLTVLTFVCTWTFKSFQNLTSIQNFNETLIREAFQMTRVAVDLNNERDSSIVYVTARSVRARLAARKELHYVRRQTDLSLAELVHWSHDTMESVDNGNGKSIVSSGSSIIDIIYRHRATLPVGPSPSAFIDQVTFYSGIIDALSTRLQMQSAAADAQFAGSSSSDIGYREATTGRSTIGWVLRSLAALVDCVNYIGAEHSGCIAFRLLACSSNAFGLRETFVYARSSYAGDAYFRSYVRTVAVLSTTSDNDHRDSSVTSSWRQQLTDAFPQLENCRRDLLYDPAAMYRGRGPGSVDSPVIGRGGCTHRWTPGFGIVSGQRPAQNRSVAAIKANEVDRLVDAETARIRGLFDRSRRELTNDAFSRLVVAACALVASVAYTLFSVVIGPFCSLTTTAVICRNCAGFKGRLRSKYDDEVRSSLPDVDKDNRQNEIDDDDGQILKSLFASSQYSVSPSADVPVVDKFLQCTDV